MNSMIQSPTIDPSDGLGAVDLAQLSLEPAVQGSSKSSHNIFAFESGSTWGNSNAASGSNDWAIPAESNNNTSGAIPSSFLSLSSGNTWGAFPTSGDGAQSPASKD